MIHIAIRILPAKRIKKAKSKNSQEILGRIERYLKNNCDEPVQILCGFWEDQQKAITYQELRQLVIDGTINEETLRLWIQDYSILVATKLSNLWTNAIIAGAAGQPILDELSFQFNTQTPGILNWLSEHGAEFVTASTQEQKAAITALLTKKMKDSHTVDELSRLIRPCIGLTEMDTKATVRLYDNIVSNLRKEHPRMKPESIQKKAFDAAQKYAERKHRARAMTIAQTESAFAYNRGADEGIRQAQAEGYLGIVKKRWNTSGDDVVCETCASLEGIEIDIDAEFDFKGKVLFKGHKQLPPAHPRCACAVEYIEIEPPIFLHIPPIDIIQTNSFREYSTEDIEQMARQTEKIISKHLLIPSMWSGTIVVKDEGILNPDGHITYYGKMWNCDILTTHETAPAIILHEQLHARSISYCEPTVYVEYGKIEEAVVQFMTEEICMKEGIEIISSSYDEMIEALKQIGHRINIYDTDYEFAKILIEKPVKERLDWLSELLYDILAKDETTTIEEYQRVSELLDILY